MVPLWFLYEDNISKKARNKSKGCFNLKTTFFHFLSYLINNLNLESEAVPLQGVFVVQRLGDDQGPCAILVGDHGKSVRAVTALIHNLEVIQWKLSIRTLEIEREVYVQ